MDLPWILANVQGDNARMTDSSLLQNWRSQLTLRHSSRARHVRLRVDRLGQVEVVLPVGFSTHELDGLLERHRPWVESRLQQLDPGLIRQATTPPSVLNLQALGQEWAFTYSGLGRPGYRRAGEAALRISGETQWQLVLRRWLAEMGREHLVPWLDQVSQEIGLSYREVRIRGQKTRWGSCSAKGNINLNYALLFLPPEWVRYLLVHELCHTVHLNHSAAFWRLVEQKFPGHSKIDRALRGAMAQVPLWLYE